MAARMTLSTVRFVSAVAPRASLRQVWAAAVEMAQARRTRRMLAEMDDRMLADVGLGRGDAMMEASRAPWDLHERRM